MVSKIQDRDFIKQLFENSAFRKLIDIEFLESNDGYAEVAFQLDPKKHWNTNEMTHGGVYASLLDAASGLSVRSKLKSNQSLATVNLSINYTKAVTKGKLIARSTVITFGRKIATAKAEIFNEDNEFIANSISTFVIMTKRGNRDA